MTRMWITPQSVFDGHTLRTDVSICVEGGQVIALQERRADAMPISGCLTPGFVDLQVNGGGGVLLNTTPTADGMSTMAEAHRSFGTVAIMPTVITDHPDVMEKAAQAALEAKGRAGLLGLHIEGPHISVARKGTHDAKYIRPMATRTLDLVAMLRDADLPVLITLAPEAVQLSQISELSKMGAIVSLGHTDAPAEQIEEAIAAGATCATHLFNAMSPMTSRAPGAVGGVLNAGIPYGIICDGFHVDDRMVRLALRATAPETMAFLVSDAMSTIGGPDTFDLYGQPVHLLQGRLVNSQGNLAGAHTTQAFGVKRLVQQIGLPLDRALRMAVTHPAALIGRKDLSDLVGRTLADVQVMDDDQNLAGTLNDILSNRSTSDAAQ